MSLRVALRRVLHHCVAHPLVGLGELVLGLGHAVHGAGELLRAVTDPTGPEECR